jgi:hypothetical protein
MEREVVRNIRPEDEGIRSPTIVVGKKVLRVADVKDPDVRGG